MELLKNKAKQKAGKLHFSASRRPNLINGMPSLLLLKVPSDPLRMA